MDQGHRRPIANDHKADFRVIHGVTPAHAVDGKHRARALTCNLRRCRYALGQ